MKSITQRLLQGLALLAIGAWCWGRAASIGAWARWERASEALQADEGPVSPEAIAAGRAGARTAEELGVVGRAAAGATLPPDHATAAAIFIEAIERDPLDATAWFRLAKERIALGDLEGARAALARSDELDPHFPRQRLGAIQLWALLGDESRAVETAKKIARLGGGFRRDAAAGLAAIGLAPERAFDELDGEALPPEEQLLILRELVSPDAAATRSLLARVEPESFATKALRDGYARILSKPVLFDRLADFWAACGGSAETINARVAADNLGLRRSPLGSGFYLGWQPFPDASLADVRWEPAEAASLFQDGHLRIELLQGAPRKGIGWTIYRFAATEGPPFKIEARVKQTPAGAFRTTLKLILDGETVASSPVAPEAEIWQAIALETPTLERASLLELEIQSSVLMGAAPGEAAPSLRLGALSFQFPPASVAAPEVKLP